MGPSAVVPHFKIIRFQYVFVAPDNLQHTEVLLDLRLPRFFLVVAQGLFAWQDVTSTNP